MGEIDSSLASRRKALWLIGAAGLVALGADSAGAATTPRTAPPGTPLRLRPAVLPAPKPTPKPTPKPRPAPWSPAPLTALKPGEPIRHLAELVPPAPPNTIALTIDDGPHPEYTPRVLDLLAEHQVHATFFIIGEQIKDNAKLVERIAADGHQICNHTMTHPIAFDDVSKKRLKTEIAEPHDLIAQTTQIVPTLFRAPGGAWSPAVLDAVAEHDMLPIDWAVDPRDWARPGAARIRKALTKSKAGDILLVHDGGGDRAQTVSALRAAIPRLKKKGLSFVAL
ncbi:polysaccharide deacetylase family protein [Actinomadura sp. 9N407]|uniref:polysaccharide deacetylase family protein n=1 Tax=Actinomadura sp. 9N407 TaxID=3375154 RepID=UPI003792B414